MNLILKRIMHKVRIIFFPTEHDKLMKKWRSDGGDEKLRYDYELNSDSLVMDFGGYKGQWSFGIHARYNCRLFIFEPVSIFADKIINRFKSNPKVKVFNFALGSIPRNEIICLCEDGSSIHKTGSEGELIRIEDVGVFFKDNNINSVALMKVNIEGGEYELLDRLIETDLIRCIKDIQIQFHPEFPDAEYRMKNIQKQLTRTHMLTYQYKFVWENWRRLL